MLIPAPADGHTSIGPQLAAALRRLVAERRPRRVLETGTFHALGTTAAIEQALDLYCPGAEFSTIEADADCHRVAGENARRLGLCCELVHGLSLPRASLPTPEQIAAELAAADAGPEPVYADYPAGERAAWYWGETDKPGVPDDRIGHLLGGRWGGACDLVVLDSAGHLGRREMARVLELLKTPCVFVLDDVRHVKHAGTLADCRRDPRFTLLRASDERFGFAALDFRP